MSTETDPRASPSLHERIERFTRDFVRPVAASLAAGSGPRPKDVVGAAGGFGLAGLLTPSALGGAGGTHRDFVDLIEAVAREDASAAVILDVHVSVGTEPILAFGNSDQRSRYLPRLASGAWLAGFALTEPGSGSDAAALQTRATADGDGYVLTGTKTFITGAGEADLYVLMARTASSDDAGKASEASDAYGITAFLVEAGWPGVSASAPFHKMGLHGSWTGELVLDCVRVPVENRLGAEGEGFRVAMSALDSGRVGISAQAVGLAQGAIDVSVAASRLRRSRGRDVDEVALADMAARTVAARALTRHAAAMVDADLDVTCEASIAKLYATDACMLTAHQAVELCAPDSALANHPAAIRLADAKACQIYEGTNQIQRMVIARELLRHSAQ